MPVNHTPELVWARRIPSGVFAVLSDWAILDVYPMENFLTGESSGKWALDLLEHRGGEVNRRRLGTYATLEAAKAAGHVYAGDNL